LLLAEELDYLNFRYFDEGESVMGLGFTRFHEAIAEAQQNRKKGYSGVFIAIVVFSAILILILYLLTH
jgi:hypothetical protein